MSTQKDIPVARRVHTSPKVVSRRSTKSSVRVYVILVLLVIIVVIPTIIIALNTIPTLTSGRQIAQSPTPQPESTQNSPSPAAKTLLGHYAYEEAPLNSLQVISVASDGYEIKLRANAATKYTEMVAAAKADGIELLAISGFRTKKEQDQLFFEISKQRSQTPAQRALVSAPPGYSEHHTGYALDLGDRATPSTNLSPNFDQTAAFKWLKLDNNAAKYGFEMSFPKNNPQGVMYEPWHWRFVGDEDSLALFYKK